MEYIPIIVCGWGVFMLGNIILSSLDKTQKKVRCNCRQELLKIKKSEKQFNKTLDNQLK